MNQINANMVLIVLNFFKAFFNFVDTNVLKVQYLPFTNIQVFEEEKESSFGNYEEINPSMDMNDFLF